MTLAAHLTAEHHEKRLLGLLNHFSYNHRVSTVFSDFIEMSALAISNAVDRAQYHARETQWSKINGRYSKEEAARFPAMLGELTMAFERRVEALQACGECDGAIPLSCDLADVLGATFMALEAGNTRAGQFFTPYEVSVLMADMTLQDVGRTIEENGFVTLLEPAVGAGGMVIAAAEAIHARGFNYQQVMHATCVDVDLRCVHMTYLQLSLLHIPAIVVHGNSLTVEEWSTWYTPAHVLGGWSRRLRRAPVAEKLERARAASPQGPSDASNSEIETSTSTR
ncbi:N-6 DNA methylase (plasmid) [Burkholderia aenigmatica]|uniref:N-6 DNA methylase n=1 Tax=Burkholderia aenigmatica TaxID=2015348 RepID=UPI003B43501E